MKAKAKPTYKPDHIVCPKCLELLSRDDIEGFGQCPYCNCEFEMDGQMEDFLLRPVVQQWMRHARANEDADLG